MGVKHQVIAAGLAAFRYSGLHRLAAPVTRGLGAILMFHHVRPYRDRGFAPNRELEIAPEFLNAALGLLARRDIAVVTLDEAAERIATGVGGPPFVALTFDDGYRDNLEYALPVLRRHGAPMTLFVTTGFADRTGHLWWIETEEALARLDRIEVSLDGETLRLPAAGPEEKQAAGALLMRKLRGAGEAGRRAAVTALAEAAAIDRRALVETLCLGWDDLRALAADPLVTIGAHTLTHPMLARLGADEARAEIVRSKAAIEAEIGRPVRHFAYPVGDPTAAGPREFAMATEAGYRSAVTTRPGMLFPEHRAHPTALPRLSVNGRFQNLDMLDVLLSGAPFALWNRGRRVNAA